MKKLLVAFSLFFALNMAPNAAQAQINSGNQTVDLLLGNLVAVNISDIQVNIGDITVNDLVDVSNVLNKNDITLLNNVLNDLTVVINDVVVDVDVDIANVLTNLLRDADILNKNQVVVGILSGGQFVIQNLNKKMKTK